MMEKAQEKEEENRVDKIDIVAYYIWFDKLKACFRENATASRWQHANNCAVFKLDHNLWFPVFV